MAKKYGLLPTPLSNHQRTNDKVHNLMSLPAVRKTIEEAPDDHPWLLCEDRYLIPGLETGPDMMMYVRCTALHCHTDRLEGI